MSKGGARNYKKDSIDKEHLADRLRDYVKMSKDPFQLQDYERMWASCRPRVSALAQLVELGHALADTCPQMTIRYSDLKLVLQDILREHPGVRPGRENPDVKAKHLADKLMVVQKHLRQVSTDPGLKELKKQLPRYLADSFEELIVKISDGSGEAPDPKRQLQARISDVSLDSEGWPAALTRPKSSPSKKQRLPDSKPEENEEGDSENELLKQNDHGSTLPCYKKDIKAIKKPAASETEVVDKIVARRPSAKPKKKAAPTEDFKLISSDLSLKGPFTNQSYIVQGKGGKPKLVVACSRKASEDFHEVLQGVLEKMKKMKGATKSTAVAERNRLLATTFKKS